MYKVKFLIPIRYLWLKPIKILSTLICIGLFWHSDGQTNEQLIDFLPLPYLMGCHTSEDEWFWDAFVINCLFFCCHQPSFSKGGSFFMPLSRHHLSVTGYLLCINNKSKDSLQNIRLIRAKLVWVKAKCSYRIPNSNLVARRNCTFRSKNNNKIKGNVKLFAATGFEFVYAINSLYFSSHFLLSYFRRSLVVTVFWFMRFRNVRGIALMGNWFSTTTCEIALIETVLTRDPMYFGSSAIPDFSFSFKKICLFKRGSWFIFKNKANGKGTIHKQCHL